MDKFEFWILDSVLEYPISVFWLSAPIHEFEMMFNREHHGQTRSMCVRTLYNLWEQGSLQLFKINGPDEEDILPIHPTIQLLEEAMDGKIHLNYALTPQGGSTWGDISNPNWQHYTFTRSDGSFQEVTAADRRVVEDYLELRPYIFADESIIPESISWDVIQPWCATYWKTLPIGHQVRFRTESREPGPPPPDWAVQRWRELTTWYTNPYASQAT